MVVLSYLPYLLLMRLKLGLLGGVVDGCESGVTFSGVGEGSGAAAAHGIPLLSLETSQDESGH